LFIGETDLGEEILNTGLIDYSKITTQENPDFQLTPDSQILFMKLEKARDEYMKHSRENAEKIKNTLSIFGYNISNIPSSVLSLFTISFFAIMIFSIYYVLNNILKKPQQANKKKNKKK